MKVFEQFFVAAFPSGQHLQHGLLLAFSLLGALLVLTPFVASGQKREGRVDRVVLVGMIVVIYMLALTTLGYLS